MMPSITAIIVDDEREGINTLQFMLQEYCPQVQIIGTYESSIEGLKAIKRDQPQLLFLDINMPHINGLELLELVGTDIYNAIFTTAYDEFVLQALRLNALDYLKKPINETELTAAVARAKPKSHILPEQIGNVLQLVNNLEIETHTPIAIKEGNKLKFVHLRDITHCKSDGNFTYVFLSNGKNIYSSTPLINFEETLPEQYFFRIHREYIVNRLQIVEYDKADGGAVTVTTGQQLPISRGRKGGFMEFLEGDIV